ncbi:hypothetical protein LCGC14_3127160 [marine sediment metagenome]|uniref:Uncharacterized protein n=1 Tax=marine sediment metagenome TaxID=412755 RepID=A0A0F8W0T4_9ZZZZ
MIQATAETIRSVEQLNAIRRTTRKKQQQPGKTKILVCMGGGCIASGAREVMTGLQAAGVTAVCVVQDKLGDVHVFDAGIN